jgi:4-hydroxy-3-polyprenylbenzoate decarboxylase
MTKRIIIGISGASGVTYGVRMLEVLIEVEAMADFVYDHKDMAASISSGSFLTHAMVVIPCTIKSLSGIANSYNENLLVRAADVTLKEKRKLVLVVRETPLHVGHLRLMTMAAEMGAHLLPPMPSFYHQPKTIDDIIDQTIGKVFDYIGIEHDLFNRWGEPGEDPKARGGRLKKLKMT